MPVIIVDPLFVWPFPPANGAERHFGNGKQSCHMMVFGEPAENLITFAVTKLLLRRAWYQSPPKASHAHFDLTPSKRALAVRKGAVEVTEQEFRKLASLFALISPETVSADTMTVLPNATCPICHESAGQHAVDLTVLHARILCHGQRVVARRPAAPVVVAVAA